MVAGVGIPGDLPDIVQADRRAVVSAKRSQVENGCSVKEESVVRPRGGGAIARNHAGIVHGHGGGVITPDGADVAHGTVGIEEGVEFGIISNPGVAGNLAEVIQSIARAGAATQGHEIDIIPPGIQKSVLSKSAGKEIACDFPAAVERARGKERSAQSLNRDDGHRLCVQQQALWC